MCQRRPGGAKAVRDNYYIDGDPRPRLRGKLMAVCLPVWPWAVGLHWLALAFLQPDRADLIVLRGLVAFATWFNVLTTDRYHRGDLAHPALDYEISWLRWDFVAISAALSSHFALWAAHFNYWEPLGPMAAAGFVATGLVGCAAFCLFEMDATHTCFQDPSGRWPPKPASGPRTTAGRCCILGLFALQFFGLFGYMVQQALRTPCAPSTLIWWVHLPGILCYVSQMPRDGPAWGAHDLFHAFVLAGYVASVVLDAVNTAGWDCAASVS